MHSDLRAPLFWETSFVPKNSPTDLFRRWLAKGQIITLNALSPGFKAVHRLGTEQPHECITMQAASLRSMQFHAANNVRNYNDWLKQCDWQPAYHYHEIFLKCLQAHKKEKPKRWILKAPGHLLSMPALFEKYPDSKIIHLHRDPSEVIPSMASLFFHIRKPFTSCAVKEEIGADVKNQWCSGISATMKYRAENPEKNARFIDINYKTLILDPLSSLKEIGTHCDLTIGDNYTHLIKNYLDQINATYHSLEDTKLFQILAETGIIGFIFYIIAFLYVLYNLFKNFIKNFLIFENKKFVNICFLICFMQNLLFILPSGNIFNNFLALQMFLPLGFYLYVTSLNEI